MMIDEALLNRYFNQQCTSEERRLVEAYLAEDSELAALHNLLASETTAVTPQPLPREMDEAITAVLKKEMKKRQPAGIVLLKKSWRAVAAAAVLIPVLLWSYRELNQRAKAAPAIAANTAAPAMRTLANHTSTTRKARMPDGSTIWLAAYSTISYDALQYGKTNREMFLEGEAFFEVQQQPRHPFIVHHGGIVTEVLGTSFNVEAYAEESAIRVTLVSGRVAVRRDNSGQPGRMLQPGQVLSYHKNNGAMLLRAIAVEDSRCWTSGALVFNDIPLADALHRMERRYHLSIVLPPGLSLDGKRVTAIFNSGTPEEILRNLLFVHGMSFSNKGNKIAITQQP